MVPCPPRVLVARTTLLLRLPVIWGVKSDRTRRAFNAQTENCVVVICTSSYFNPGSSAAADEEPGAPSSWLGMITGIVATRDCRPGSPKGEGPGPPVRVHLGAFLASQTGLKVTNSTCSMQIKPLQERRQSPSIEESIEAVAGGVTIARTGRRYLVRHSGPRICDCAT